MEHVSAATCEDFIAGLIETGTVRASLTGNTVWNLSELRNLATANAKEGRRVSNLASVDRPAYFLGENPDGRYEFLTVAGDIEDGAAAVIVVLPKTSSKRSDQVVCARLVAALKFDFDFDFQQLDFVSQLIWGTRFEKISGLKMIQGA